MRNIDGQILRQMLVSAANNLYNHYPEIDALNVFPVPDGDTGMNMNLTLASGSKEIANRNDEDVFAIASCFSKGLLMGANICACHLLASVIFPSFAMRRAMSCNISASSCAYMSTSSSPMPSKERGESIYFTTLRR